MPLQKKKKDYGNLGKLRTKDVITHLQDYGSKKRTRLFKAKNQGI